uniref:Uncharacterized protein n=1 Tax=Sus scrofa TaxID=9823 RepID=A0A4X1TIS2_PIG
MGQSVLRDGRVPFRRDGRWPPLPSADRKGVGFRSRIRSGGDGRREASSAVTQPIPEKPAGAPGEFSFLCEGQGALEWVRPERGARALESVPISAAGLQGEQPLACWNNVGKGSRQAGSVTSG